MDDKGSLSTDIVVILVILLLIFGITSIITTQINEKIETTISTENMEKICSETCDNLINNPGFPQNWNELDNPYNITIGLAIVDENNKTISNSVSYDKFIKLNQYYDNLINYKVFNNSMKSSITLEPIESSISSVTIGNEIAKSNVYTVERVVICDFFSKYVIKNFNNEKECNQHHDNSYSCDYFKIYSSNLETYDYYLLVEKNSYKSLKYSIDTTKEINTNFKSLSSNKIYLNDMMKEKLKESNNEIFFVHLNDENVKAVIVGVPKAFDKKQIDYDYFQKVKCNLKFKISY